MERRRGAVTSTSWGEGSPNISSSHPPPSWLRVSSASPMVVMCASRASESWYVSRTRHTVWVSSKNQSYCSTPGSLFAISMAWAATFMNSARCELVTWVNLALTWILFITRVLAARHGWLRVGVGRWRARRPAPADGSGAHSLTSGKKHDLAGHVAAFDVPMCLGDVVEGEGAIKMDAE